MIKLLSSKIDKLNLNVMELNREIEELNMRLSILEKSKENSDNMYRILKQETDEIIFNKTNIIKELEEKI